MSDSAFEKVIAEIESLSPDHLLQLRRRLDEKLRALQRLPELPITPRIIGKSQPPKDRSKENEWLARHRDEYAGQWVALDGDRLIGHSTRFEDVSRAVKESGIRDALIFIVEGSDAPPFAGV